MPYSANAWIDSWPAFYHGHSCLRQTYVVAHVVWHASCRSLRLPGGLASADGALSRVRTHAMVLAFPSAVTVSQSATDLFGSHVALPTGGQRHEPT